MSDIQVSFVPAEFSVEVWPKIRSYVSAATKRAGGRYDPEDILYEVIDGHQLLWVAIKDSSVVGVVTTKMIDYPRMRVLAVPVIGGLRFKEWGAQMLALLRSWAEENGCEMLEGYGRPGWAKVFEGDGYKHLWSCAEVPINAASTGE